MATPPVINESFLREVDEELRRDQALGFWKRWGRWLIAAVLGGLALLAGYLWWSADREAKAGVEGEQLSAVLDDLSTSKDETLGPRLDRLAHAHGAGIVVAAKLTRADLALQKGDLKAAAAGFAAIASDASLAQPYRDMALVRHTAAEFDTMAPQAVVSRLKPLAISGNPWFGSAGEMVGIAYMKMGRNELAGATFAAIAGDETVPATIRSRIVQLAGILGVDATRTPKKGNSGQ